MIPSPGICNTCLQRYVVTVAPHERGLLADYENADHHLKCARLCGGFVMFGQGAVEVSKGAQLAPALHVTATEYVRALDGLGLKDEVTDDPDLVLALLKTNKVVDADLEVAMGRVFLHELKLENGMTVHLASGAKGATVLKVTRGSDAAR